MKTTEATCAEFFSMHQISMFFSYVSCLFEDISIDIHFSYVYIIYIYIIYRKYTDLHSFWFYQRLDSQLCQSLILIPSKLAYSHGGVKLTEETEELRGDPAPVSQQLVGSLLQRLPQAMPAMVESSDLKSATVGKSCIFSSNARNSKNANMRCSCDFRWILVPVLVAFVLFSCSRSSCFFSLAVPAVGMIYS